MERTLKTISKQLKKSTKAHAKQAKQIDSMLSMKKKTSPALAKISASCKAYAKRRFKVWPSAYASGFAVKSQKAGKC